MTLKRAVLLLVIVAKLVMVIVLSRKLMEDSSTPPSPPLKAQTDVTSDAILINKQPSKASLQKPDIAEESESESVAVVVAAEDKVSYPSKLLSHHKDDVELIKITPTQVDAETWYRKPTKDDLQGFKDAIEKWIETSEPGEYPNISTLDISDPVCSDIFRFGGVHNSKSPTGWPICMELLPDAFVEPKLHKTFKGCSGECRPPLSDYVPLPKQIKAKSTPCVVYSFGIGEEDSFEQHLSLDTKCEVFAFDPVVAVGKWVSSRDTSVSQIKKIGDTPKTKNQVKSLLENAVIAMKQDKETSRYYTQMSILNSKGTVQFNPWGLAATSAKKELQNSWSKGQGASITLKSLKDIQSSLQHSEINILKLDIEGFEWQVLSDVLSIPSISQLMIELHFGGAAQWLEAFQALYASGFHVYHSEKLRYHGRGCKKSKTDPKCRGGLQEVSFMRIPV